MALSAPIGGFLSLVLFGLLFGGGQRSTGERIPIKPARGVHIEIFRISWAFYISRSQKAVREQDDSGYVGGTATDGTG